MAAALVSVSYGLTVGTPSWTTSGRFVGLQSRRWRCCPYTWMMMFSSRCGVFHGTFAWGWKLVDQQPLPQMMWKCVNQLNSFDKFIFMCNICSRWNNYNIAHQTKNRLKAAPKSRQMWLLHSETNAFEPCQVCRGLPPLAKGPVQQAALSLQEAHFGSVGKNDSRVRDASWMYTLHLLMFNIRYWQFVQCMCLICWCYHRKWMKDTTLDMYWYYIHSLKFQAFAVHIQLPFSTAPQECNDRQS